MDNSHFNELVFRALSEKSQEKVEHIYNIAHILHTHQQPKMTVKDFDYLYDLEIPELEHIGEYTKCKILVKSIRE